mmetsp:Transcript_30971/g.35790  ORF Transcript_30971/g.35790 Transcript_30971/m.35790 type:complete len:535 (+) Transcript_30971:917-2521(+)
MINSLTACRRRATSLGITVALNRHPPPRFGLMRPKKHHPNRNTALSRKWWNSRSILRLHCQHLSCRRIGTKPNTFYRLRNEISQQQQQQRENIHNDNHGDLLHMELTNVYIASRFYRVKQLENQIQSVDSNGNMFGDQSSSGLGSMNKNRLLGLRLGWQERVTLHYVVIPLEEYAYTLTTCPIATGFSTTTMADRTSSVIRKGDTVDISMSDVTDFACLERSNRKLMDTVHAYNEDQQIKALEELNNEGGGPRSISSIRREATLSPDAASSSAKQQQGNQQQDHSSKNGNDDDASNTNVNSTQHQHHPTSIRGLCPLDEPNNMSMIHLICAWQSTSCRASAADVYSQEGGRDSGDDIVSGLHYLLDLPVRPHTRGKGCPLTVTAKHKSDVYHNFRSGPLEIDLEVTVRNRIAEQLLPMNSNSSSKLSKNKPFSSPSSEEVEFEFVMLDQPEFQLLGADSFQWKLDCGDELVVPLKAVFSSGGIYNLQSVRLTIFDTHKSKSRNDSSGAKVTKKVPYLFPLQWLIKVHDSNGSVL